MPFPTLQFPLYSLADEVRPLFAILQYGIHALKGAFREAGRGLFVVDLGASYRTLAFGARAVDALQGLLMGLLRYHYRLLRTHLIPFPPNAPLPQLPMRAALCEKGDFPRHSQSRGDLKAVKAGYLHNHPPGIGVARYADLLGAVRGAHDIQKRLILVNFVHVVSDIRIVHTLSIKQENFRYHLLTHPELMISSNHQQQEIAMTKLTLGTAQILKVNGQFILKYMNHGSFLVGERDYATEAAAREFCRERGLRVI